MSTIVAKAFEKPFSMAALGARPARSSSRMRSKTRTFESTAMPIVRMNPAIPGRVSVASNRAMAAARSSALRMSAKIAFQPARR